MLVPPNAEEHTHQVVILIIIRWEGDESRASNCLLLQTELWNLIHHWSEADSYLQQDVTVQHKCCLEKEESVKKEASIHIIIFVATPELGRYGWGTGWDRAWQWPAEQKIVEYGTGWGFPTIQKHPPLLRGASAQMPTNKIWNQSKASSGPPQTYLSPQGNTFHSEMPALLLNVDYQEGHIAL